MKETRQAAPGWARAFGGLSHEKFPGFLGEPVARRATQRICLVLLLYHVAGDSGAALVIAVACPALGNALPTAAEALPVTVKLSVTGHGIAESAGRSKRISGSELLRGANQVLVCAGELSRGAARDGSPRRKPWVSSAGGRSRVAAKENRVAVSLLSPLTGLWLFSPFPHGLRRGLPSLAAPRLSSSAHAKS